MHENSQRFWDDVAKRYSQQAIADVDSYRKKLSQTQELMTKDMTVLELGCGTGSTALIHADYVAQIVATDISQEMIAIAKNKADSQRVQNIKFIRSSLEEFKSDEAKYDMILALNLLHLISDRESALGKIFSLLKPGGFFVSSTVCAADKMWFIRPIVPVMQWFGRAPHFEFLKAEQVSEEIHNAGFSIKESWSHGKANSLFVIARKSTH